ncbi:MAG: ABC transporter substrate-binding protein [Thermoanaerobaculia bacterium]
MRNGLATVVCAGLLAAGCSSDQPILVGAVLSLTGENDYYGGPIRDGIQLAYSQIQADTEYPYELELRVVDSQSNADTAATMLKQLYEEGSIAAIGGVTSVEALQMVPISEDHERVLVSPSATSPQLSGISSYFFRVIPSDFLGGTKMAGFATQTLGLETAVVLAREEAYGRGVQQVFEAEFERLGGEVLETIEYPPGTMDFTGLVERVLNLDPGGVYLAGFAQDIAAIVEGLRAGGYDGDIMTTDAFATPDIIAEAGGVANGVYLTQTVFDTTSEEPTVKAFVDAFRAQYDAEPSFYAAHGYDAMQVIAAAVAESGRLPSEFWKAMKGIRAFPGVTGSIQFDDRGDAQKFPRVYIISRGQLLDYDTEVAERRQELLRRLEDLRRGRSGDG